MVKVDVKLTYDDRIVLGAGQAKCKLPAQGEVREFKCCTDDPLSNCDQAAPEPTERDLLPLYYFQVAIGDAVRGYGSDPANPPWTARLACHSHDLNRWIDETIDPWERVWCDARYGAHVWVTFTPTGTTTHESIDPPHNNPCASGDPLYEITQGADEGFTFTTTLGHERVGCG